MMKPETEGATLVAYFKIFFIIFYGDITAEARTVTPVLIIQLTTLLPMIVKILFMSKKTTMLFFVAGK